MKAEKKEKRLSFRLTDQIAIMLEDASKSLHKSKSEVIAVAIFNFWQDDKKFIICPGCGKKRWVREEMPLLPDEITEFNCECGTKFWWDDEKGKVVKVKNTEKETKLTELLSCHEFFVFYESWKKYQELEKNS